MAPSVVGGVLIVSAFVVVVGDAVAVAAREADGVTMLLTATLEATSGRGAELVAAWPLVGSGKLSVAKLPVELVDVALGVGGVVFVVDVVVVVEVEIKIAGKCVTFIPSVSPVELSTLTGGGGGKVEEMAGVSGAGVVVEPSGELNA